VGAPEYVRLLKSFQTDLRYHGQYSFALQVQKCWAKCDAFHVRPSNNSCKNLKNSQVFIIIILRGMSPHRLLLKITLRPRTSRIRASERRYMNEDFETMAGGGETTQKQVQFLCPQMNHLYVDEKFSMRTPKGH